MSRKRLVLVTAAAVLALAGGSDRGAAAPPPSREVTFVDLRRGFALTVQLDRGSPESGVFRFRVPGRGLYEGRVGAALATHSATSTTIHFRGTATLRAPANLTAPNAPASAVAVQVRLEAELDPLHHKAEATLRDGEDEFHLVTRPAEKEEVEGALADYERAALGQDWAALYAMMNSDVTAAYSQASFAAQGAGESSQTGPITALRRIAAGDVQITDSGATYVVATYDVTVRGPSGSATTSRWDLFLIRQTAGWRIWASVAR